MAQGALPARAKECSVASFLEQLSEYYGDRTSGSSRLCLARQIAHGGWGWRSSDPLSAQPTRASAAASAQDPPKGRALSQLSSLTSYHAVGKKKPQVGAKPRRWTEGAVTLRVLGVEGSGHHATSFDEGVLGSAEGLAALRALNASLEVTPSFPSSSRTIEATRGMQRMVDKGMLHSQSGNEIRYIAHTDRTVLGMQPFNKAWSDAGATFGRSTRDARSLYVVLARDPFKSALSNLGRWYQNAIKDNRTSYEVRDFSDAGIELELRSQALAYGVVENVARAVPCRRVFALPLEVMMADPCSTAKAMARFVGDNSGADSGAADVSAASDAFVEHFRAYFAPKHASSDKWMDLRFERCADLRGGAGGTKADIQGLKKDDNHARLEECEERLGAFVEAYFRHLRFMWPLQLPGAEAL